MHVMHVCISINVYMYMYVQASSRDVMTYWLDQLQSRRRRFSKRRKKNTHREKAVSAELHVCILELLGIS